MNRKCLLEFLILTLVIGCTPYVASHTESQDVISKPDSNVVIQSEPQKHIELTFIDTLNDGKEVLLKEDDFIASSSIKAGKNGSGTIQSEKNGTFRIQVSTSKQPDKIKEDRKKIGKQLNLSTTIVYEAPYYKLYTGTFSQRAEADSVLSKIKKLGYQNACVVVGNKK